MKKTVLILGSGGLVGSAIKRRFETQDQYTLLTPLRDQLDLLNQTAVSSYFLKFRPQYVFLAAAKVGGIKANDTYRADFIFQNLQIQNNVFGAAFEYQTERLLFLGSSCIYPRDCAQPIKEEFLLTGPLEKTNEPYAIAKIAGLKTAESFRRQYNRHFFTVMPTNLYGENDNFHPENSHVIPGLIRRMHEAKVHGLDRFEVWGTGAPKREFLYVDDLASACELLMTSDPNLTPDAINVGSGEDVTVRDLAGLIARVVGYNGEIVFNPQYPDGTPRKLLDNSKIKALGWKPTITLESGLRKTYEYFLKKTSS